MEKEIKITKKAARRGFVVAGLVTERFGEAKTSMPGGFTPPEQMKSLGSP